MKRSIPLLATLSIAISCFVMIIACGKHETCALLGTDCEEEDETSSSSGNGSNGSSGGGGNSSSSSYRGSSSSGGSVGELGGCFTYEIYVGDEFDPPYYPIPGGLCLTGPTTDMEACAAMNADWDTSCPSGATLTCPVKDGFTAYFYDNMYAMFPVPCSLFSFLGALDL